MSTHSVPNDKPVKIPGPDHPIMIEHHRARVIVMAGGHVIADTHDALTLLEARYLAVLYIPRKDVDMTRLERTAHATYCPYKGECAYFSIPSAGERGTNAVWTYEHPYDAVAPIREHLAFYPDRVDSITQEPAAH
ncbi:MULTISPECIES: DUF427 domain-containing protein [Paraburkholderia]|uniref:DUF427 domain-containing protein n=1 Tax=Paraburkholderia TaxID=1822464 RepID=UPI000379CCD1|nr:MULTISPECIES: DUF427 domain-containing protein [Paraburkholderia]MDH6146930.1 uncharacterized protein (DUF427 family) [Paraburkholderia sp. WSM4179]